VCTVATVTKEGSGPSEGSQFEVTPLPSIYWNISVSLLLYLQNSACQWPMSPVMNVCIV